jgi:PhoH-like ATPase
MYQGIKVIENFDKWNEFNSEDIKLGIEDLPEGEYYENMGIVLKCSEPKAKDHAIIKNGYLERLAKYYPCKVKPANTEQAFALELLRDDTIPLVSLIGAAGSGKTFLACAHIIQQLEKGKTKKVLIAKSMSPVGREIGFLPGGLEEKVNVWLGAIFDNFEKLGKGRFDVEEYVRTQKIEITPITFIQGRSLSNTILVVDEIQNLDMDIIKQIITRAGEGCKVILLGDPTQRFESGVIDLEKFVDKCKNTKLAGHLTFRKSVRSQLAQWAVENL